MNKKGQPRKGGMPTGWRKNKIFSLLVVSMLSLSIIVDLDFENLSAIDWALIVSTGAMWFVNAVYFARRLFKNA